jgi:hypothetical protein
LKRLATDGPLRTGLGLAARTHWERSHTLACMAEDYARVIDRALARPAVPACGLPAHLEADGTELTRRLLGQFGADVDFLRRLPRGDLARPAVE